MRQNSANSTICLKACGLAKQPVGDAALDKLVLYCAGLVIRAVKHGKLIPCFALRRHFLYFFCHTNTSQYELVRLLAAKYQNLCVVGDDDHFFCHKTAFVIFVICFINMQYTAAVILSPKRFVLAGLVIVDNGVCGFQDFFCGTVILLQLDYDRAVEIPRVPRSQGLSHLSASFEGKQRTGF